MNKKTLIQFLILVLIIVILVALYKISTANKKNSNPIKINIPEDNLSSKDSNLIYNLKYTVVGKDGISYNILSELGELNDNQPDIVLMKKVTAVISNDNEEPMTIIAENAVYNSINYNTSFYEKVLITYQEQEINSENLDLIFEKNIATITNNITYKNKNTNLQADKIEIDILTKDLRIFMYDNQKKIKIISIN